MTTLQWISVGAVVLAVLTAGLLLYGQARWSRLTAQLMSRLEAARKAPRPARYDAARELEGLPPVVQRFFRTVLRDGAPMVAAVTVTHSGSFNMSDSSGERWKPFTSTQRVVTRRPGFVWDGRVQMAQAWRCMCTTPTSPAKASCIRPWPACSRWPTCATAAATWRKAS